MDPEEMDQRRDVALEALQDAINQLGPITDETAFSIREPILEIIESIEGVGEELQALDFTVYSGSELRSS